MTLDQIIKEIDRMDEADIERLLIHIEQRRGRDMGDDWTQAFDQAVDALREGLTREEIDAMVQAMNAEYIKPADEDQWRD